LIWQVYQASLFRGSSFELNYKMEAKLPSSTHTPTNKLKSIVLVPVYTQFGYGEIDLSKCEKALESPNACIIQVNLRFNAVAYVQVSSSRINHIINL
jgi:hypothetical protein